MKKVLLLLGAFAFALKAGAVISFVNPVGLPAGGMQGSGGPYNLGLQFNVNSPILVDQIGAYDSTGDGFGSTVQVAIYSITANTFVSPLVTFTGTSGTLNQASRFQSVASFVLNPGAYVVVAGGYGVAGAVDWNAYLAGDTVTPLGFNNGGGLLTLGGSYYSIGPIASFGSQAVADPYSGTQPQYAAGTFDYSAAPVPEPATWEVGLAGLLLFGGLRYLMRPSKNQPA